jgi:hypothetical protein
LTDTVEKGVAGGDAPVVRKRFLDLARGRNSDSTSASDGSWILSDHCLIGGKSEFFDSLDPEPSFAISGTRHRDLEGVPPRRAHRLHRALPQKGEVEGGRD